MSGAFVTQFAGLGNFVRVRVSLQVAHHEVKLLAEHEKIFLLGSIDKKERIMTDLIISPTT